MRTQNIAYKSLFARIVIRLFIPLLGLGLAFCVIELTSQIQTANELHYMKSRAGIETVKTSLENFLKKNDSLGTLEEPPSGFNTIASVYGIKDMQIFNLLQGKTLLKTSMEPWTAKDTLAAKTSFNDLQKNKPQHVIINKATKKIVAYIPIKIDKTSELFTVRIISPLTSISAIILTSRSTFVYILLFVIVTTVVMGYSLSRSIVQPIQVINKATKDIMDGKLGKHVHVKTGDEIEALADAFNHMSDTLQEMKSSAEDANPLTHLPGNQGIYRELQRRIYEHQKFVVFHVDIDRFKLFNDHFGLAKGDLVITKTADVLKKGVKEKGTFNDYVGHQGGDDFIIIALADHAKELGDHICALFDHEVRKAVYSKEDFENNYTIQLDRRRMAETGEEHTCKFPLISLSIAGVSNKRREIADYSNFMKLAVGAKKKAKSIIESVCLIEE